MVVCSDNFAPSYDIYVIDPPWPKKKGGLRQSRPNQGRVLDYSTMSVSEIFRLLDTEILNNAQTHAVFLWCIDEFLIEAENNMASLGYNRHARLIWDKQNGVAPAFSVRYSHEYVLWFYKPKFMKVSVESRGKLPTVFTEKAREHSRKPDVFYSMVDTWYPDLSKIDVFSREKREGWSQYGNQCNHFKLKTE